MITWPMTTFFLLFGYFSCPTKSGLHALQANTHVKHEIIQCGKAFVWSTTGLSCPPWCYWSSFSAVLWNPASLLVSRVIWASFRGVSLPFSEYLRRGKCKAALSFLALPSVSSVPPWCQWLLVPPRAYWNTLCRSHQLQKPFSIMLTPVTHIPWPIKKVQI